MEKIDTIKAVSLDSPNPSFAVLNRPIKVKRIAINLYIKPAIYCGNINNNISYKDRYSLPELKESLTPIPPK